MPYTMRITVPKYKSTIMVWQDFFIKGNNLMVKGKGLYGPFILSILAIVNSLDLTEYQFYSVTKQRWVPIANNVPLLSEYSFLS